MNTALSLRQMRERRVKQGAGLGFLPMPGGAARPRYQVDPTTAPGYGGLSRDEATAVALLIINEARRARGDDEISNLPRPYNTNPWTFLGIYNSPVVRIPPNGGRITTPQGRDDRTLYFGSNSAPWRLYVQLRDALDADGSEPQHAARITRVGQTMPLPARLERWLRPVISQTAANYDNDAAVFIVKTFPDSEQAQLLQRIGRVVRDAQTGELVALDQYEMIEAGLVPLVPGTPGAPEAAPIAAPAPAPAASAPIIVPSPTPALPSPPASTSTTPMKPSAPGGGELTVQIIEDPRTNTVTGVDQYGRWVTVSNTDAPQLVAAGVGQQVYDLASLGLAGMRYPRGMRVRDVLAGLGDAPGGGRSRAQEARQRGDDRRAEEELQRLQREAERLERERQREIERQEADARIRAARTAEDDRRRAAFQQQQADAEERFRLSQLAQERPQLAPPTFAPSPTAAAPGDSTAPTEPTPIFDVAVPPSAPTGGGATFIPPPGSPAAQPLAKPAAVFSPLATPAATSDFAAKPTGGGGSAFSSGAAQTGGGATFTGGPGGATPTPKGPPKVNITTNSRGDITGADQYGRWVQLSAQGEFIAAGVGSKTYTKQELGLSGLGSWFSNIFRAVAPIIAPAASLIPGIGPIIAPIAGALTQGIVAGGSPQVQPAIGQRQFVFAQPQVLPASYQQPGAVPTDYNRFAAEKKSDNSGAMLLLAAAALFALGGRR